MMYTLTLKTEISNNNVSHITLKEWTPPQRNLCCLFLRDPFQEIVNSYRCGDKHSIDTYSILCRIDIDIILGPGRARNSRVTLYTTKPICIQPCSTSPAYRAMENVQLIDVLRTDNRELKSIWNSSELTLSKEEKRQLKAK